MKAISGLELVVGGGAEVAVLVGGVNLIARL